MPESSLRLERAESSRLVWAFVISLVFHVLVFGAYEAGNKLEVWQRLHLPKWLQSQRMLTELVQKKEVAQLKPLPPKQPQVPLMFVDVSPEQAVAEPPKNPKGYSDRNSLAANPDATKITDIPKIDGKQTEIVRTEDVPRERPVALQPAPLPQPPPPPQPTPPLEPAPPPPPKPAPPPPTPAPEAKPASKPVPKNQPEANPKPAYTPGELVMAKPLPTPRKSEGDAPEKKAAEVKSQAPLPRAEEGEAKEVKPSRPRTVKEALARLQTNRLPGEKMNQDGGVPRRSLEPGFDVAASPFGAYDRALIEAISHRWYSLLDQHAYASDNRGKVVLQFYLNADGTVSQLNVAENTVGEMLSLLCQRAILDPQPFERWPSDMRRLLGNSRSIQFTFYYN